MSRTIADLIQERFGLPTRAGRERPADGALALLLSAVGIPLGALLHRFSVTAVPACAAAMSAAVSLALFSA